VPRKQWEPSGSLERLPASVWRRAQTHERNLGAGFSLDPKRYVVGRRMGREVLNDLSHVVIENSGAGHVDGEGAALRHLAKDALERGLVEKSHMFGEPNLQAPVGGLFTIEVELVVVDEDLEERDDHTEHDPREQVGEYQPEDRHHEGQELPDPLSPHLSKQRNSSKPVADEDQNGRQARERDPIQHAWKGRHTDQEQHTVHEGGESGSASRVDIGGASDDHLGQGNATKQTRDDVPEALCLEFLVRRRHTFLRVEVVGRLDGKQGLDASHEGQGKPRRVHQRIENLGEIGPFELGEELPKRGRHRDRHQVLRCNAEAVPKRREQNVEGNPQNHNQQLRCLVYVSLFCS